MFNRLLSGHSILWWLGFSMSVQSQSIQLVTEHYPPFNYEEKGEIIGDSTLQVKAMMKLAELDFSLKIYPWKRAYQEALIRPSTCVFTTAKTPERTPLFHWVLPLAINRSLFVSTAGNPTKLSSVKDAETFKVGVQSGFAEISILAEKGFDTQSLITFIRFEKLLTLLKLGRLDFIAMAESRFNELKATEPNLRRALIISEMKMGLACNKETPKPLIDKMQQALKTVRKNAQ